jgi:hypothetical protein
MHLVRANDVNRNLKMSVNGACMPYLAVQGDVNMPNTTALPGSRLDSSGYLDAMKGSIELAVKPSCK